ncbi:hydoxy methyltransferase [Clostridiaceae bacterium]|nr:hydoxy methyltransferase [Clostridiaceae bacterium]
MSKYISRFETLYQNVMSFEEKSIPLCAAENPISPFAKLALDSRLQEKYIMGGILQLDKNNNFIEAELLFQFYQLINAQCNDLFHCKYADPRALSGVNAVMVLLMSLFKEGDTILISSKESGGHSSMPLICRRLGISTIDLPFDFETMDFDYDVTNQIIREKYIRGVLICPSDLLWQPCLEKIQLPTDCILIYDATQTLGLMAHQINENPLDKFLDENKFILMGATHKTVPGPTCGLIMTKNLDLARQFDCLINPSYLRNVQFHHILSLSLVLMELEVFGYEYASNIVRNANYLGQYLEQNGFDVVKKGKTYTNTHQLFIQMPTEHLDKFMKHSKRFGITLNARYKQLYRGQGIRIGVQEVTRYGWGKEEMREIAGILTTLQQTNIDSRKLEHRISSLTNHREIHYTFDLETVKRIYNILHDRQF